MASLITPLVFAFFCILLEAPNVFGVESNEEHVKHITHALFRKSKAGIESVAANDKAQESKLVSNANQHIVDFRKYIFSNYDVKNKKVDECVNKALSIIENDDFTPTDCRQTELYVKVHDETLKEFSEENILKKANQLCGDLKKKNSSQAVECVLKAYKEIEKKCGEPQTKAKFDNLVKRTKVCLQKHKEKYNTAKKNVQKCPKK